MSMVLSKAPSKNSIIIMAAGLGKRMHSSLPKVLVPVCGRPMLYNSLSQIEQAFPGINVAVVVGHQKEKVIEGVTRENFNLKINFIEQSEQKGTGHAIKCAMAGEWGKRAISQKENILVLSGDLPLLTSELVSEMLEPMKRGAALRLLTAVLKDPFGYGRVIRKSKAGEVLRIVEEKDASSREKLVQEVGLSIYTFQAQFLASGVESLKNNNAQKEYYLTDLIQIASSKKRGIEVRQWENIDDVRGVNNPYELSQAGEILNSRIIRNHALNGVRFVSLSSCRVEPSVKIAADVSIEPGVILKGNTEIGEGAFIGANVVLNNVVVGKGAEVKAGTYAEDSRIGDQAKVGPYAHLRPESDIGASSKIGNFVELKKTKIGSETSVAHLSYLGDAEVGSRVNIGCGFVTCNYDGRVINGSRKHKTTIEDDAFIGSDCQTVAPVTVKKGAFVASGSTVTEDVPEGALAIARARQVTKPGYAKKLKEK